MLLQLKKIQFPSCGFPFLAMSILIEQHSEKHLKDFPRLEESGYGHTFFVKKQMNLDIQRLSVQSKIISRSSSTSSLKESMTGWWHAFPGAWEIHYHHRHISPPHPTHVNDVRRNKRNSAKSHAIASSRYCIPISCSNSTTSMIVWIWTTQYGTKSLAVILMERS